MLAALKKLFDNKQTTREACIKRYGAIDFAHQVWPNSQKWIGMLEIPEGWFPDWHVMGTKMPVKHIAANKDMHKPLLAALTAVKNKGLGAQLKTFDGCFNVRLVRGSNTAFSAHSYGLAIDLNAKTNPMSKTKLVTDFSPEFVKCFTDQGFAWGGNFKSRKDAMHFSYCFEG